MDSISFDDIVDIMAEVGDMMNKAFFSNKSHGQEIENGRYSPCNGTNPFRNDLHIGIEVVSLCILLLLSFMTPRISFFKKWCYGRPGPVVPMKPLYNHDHGIAYTFAFLAVSEFIYAYIFDNSTLGIHLKLKESNPSLKLLLQLLYVLIFTVLSYPFFAAITYRNLVAYVTGIGFLGVNITSSILTIYFSTKCETPDKKISTTFKTVFSIFFMFILLCIFIRRIILHVIKNGWKLNDENYNPINDEQLCYKYVKTLLAYHHPTGATKDESTRLQVNRLKDIGTKVCSEIYRDIPGFRVPPRLVIGVSMGTYFAYHITIDKIDDLTPWAWNLINELSREYSLTNMSTQFAFKVIYANKTLYSKTVFSNALRNVIFLYIHLVVGCIIAGLVLAFSNAIIHSFLIIRNYRLHFHKMATSGFSNIIRLETMPSTNELVLGFAKFSGFQAAYLLWSIMVIFAFSTVLLYFIIGVVLIPLFCIPDSWIRSTATSLVPLIVVTALIYFTQWLAVKYIFVSERGKVMNINNKRAFDIYCHLAFFLNVLIGFIGSLQRVFIWLFSGIICFGRIDFSSLPQYLQGLDSGFMCYVGFIFTEQYHYNPILRCFVHLLVKSSTDAAANISLTHSTSIGKTKIINAKNRRINYGIKWRVAYTLIKNPRLISMQKVFMKDNSK